MHRVIDDNSNRYMSIIMDAMRINQGWCRWMFNHRWKTNADAARVFDFLKDFDQPLWDVCINHGKLLVVTQVFTIKLEHELSEVDYNRIVKCVRS
jgi:hypothetical protein